jgi:hypothetical protein
MAIVDVDDLRDYMSGIGLETSQWAAAEMVLDGVQHELELHINRPVQPTLVREWKSVQSDGYVRLSVTPVHTIRSVVSAEGAVSPDGTAFTLSPLDKTDFENNYANKVPTAFNAYHPSKGGLYLTDVGWGMLGTFVVVEYVGGYVGWSDAAIRYKILEVAARIMTNNHDDTTSIADGVVRPASPDPVQARGWTEDELRRFDRIRRRVVV